MESHQRLADIEAMGTNVSVPITFIILWSVYSVLTIYIFVSQTIPFAEYLEHGNASRIPDLCNLIYLSAELFEICFLSFWII